MRAETASRPESDHTLLSELYVLCVVWLHFVEDFAEVVDARRVAVGEDVGGLTDRESAKVLWVGVLYLDQPLRFEHPNRVVDAGTWDGSDVADLLCGPEG